MTPPARRMRSPFTLERVARALAWTAGLWFAFAAAWGIDQTPGGGHSDSGSCGTRTSIVIYPVLV